MLVPFLCHGHAQTGTRERVTAQIIRSVDGKGIANYTVRIRMQGRQVTQTFGGKKDAATWARATEAAMERGDYGTSKTEKPRTVAALIDDFEKERIPKYADGDKMMVRLAYWKRTIGKMPVQRLTLADIAEARTTLRKTMVNGTGKPIINKTVNKYTAALSAEIKWASQENMLRRDNPVRMIGRLKESRADPQSIPFRADLDALRAAAEADLDPMVLRLILTTLSTGMRPLGRKGIGSPGECISGLTIVSGQLPKRIRLGCWSAAARDSRVSLRIANSVIRVAAGRWLESTLRHH